MPTDTSAPAEVVQSPADKAKRTLLGIEIPRDELTLRLMIAAIGIRPSIATSASEVLKQAERVNPGIVANFRGQADAAVIYFHECINAARQPS